MTDFGENQRAWDLLSKTYQLSVEISSDDVHYGPMGPGERELELLGDVKGKRILELACGAGQNSVALAKRGAEVIGLDFSEQQLESARRACEAMKVRPSFYKLDLKNLDELAVTDTFGRFDVILSCFGLEYVEDLGRLLRGAQEALKQNGKLVICDLHPFVSSADVVAVTWRRLTDSFNYFSRMEVPFSWPCSQGQVRMVRYHRTLSEYLNTILSAGFSIERVVEPEINFGAAAGSCAYFDRSILDQRDVWSSVPYSLIISARRIGGSDVVSSKS